MLQAQLHELNLRFPRPTSRLPSTKPALLYAHNMADDSDSSGLSEHSDKEIQKLAPIFVKAKKATKLVAPPPVVSPPRPKRAPSPPHEETFADNRDIAVCIQHVSARERREIGAPVEEAPETLANG